jgi:hypothetical protein
MGTLSLSWAFVKLAEVRNLALCYCYEGSYIGTEDLTLFQHHINQAGLAVVYMGDYDYIS